MTDRELMQQALEALELHAKQYPHMQKGYTVDAIAALRDRLAQPEQEPVAWMYDCGNGGRMYAEELDNVPGWIPLYTTPRQWQGLTDEEIYLNTNNIDRGEPGWAVKFARAIEAMLKEKNNGQ